MTTVPTERELTDAIADAMRQAVADLFQSHPERFYYCSLITTGEAHPPFLAAWSVEALEAAVAEEEDPAEARWELEWSYADSPYCDYGDQHFEQVRRMFAARPAMRPEAADDWRAEYDLRLDAMEAAVARLDEEGLFGTRDERLGIVVNVEVMPPDRSNTARAKRLNPPEALRAWLAEVAEPE